MNGLHLPETDLDRQLSLKFGAYASFRTPNDPIAEDYHGDSPADETDRLLDLVVQPNSNVLDLGCGAGFTLCRIAERARNVFGIDLERDLLASARERVASNLLNNVTLVEGDTTFPSTLTFLPERGMDVAYSRRGPFLTEALMAKLKPDAVFVLELAQDFLGLKSLFGRTPDLPRSVGESDWAIAAHAAVGMIPVSAKSYWFEYYFRDENHLANYLKQGSPLHNWWMPPCPFEDHRDRPALALYCRYNATPQGIRLTGHRRVYLFRRQSINYYPTLTP
jgi:SAM-dependent methyltransferase